MRKLYASYLKFHGDIIIIIREGIFIFKNFVEVWSADCIFFVFWFDNIFEIGAEMNLL